MILLQCITHQDGEAVLILEINVPETSAEHVQNLCCAGEALGSDSVVRPPARIMNIDRRRKEGTRDKM